MLFDKIKVGNHYCNAEENDIKYEVLFYDKKKKVLMVKNIKDNIVDFIIGNFKVKNNMLYYDNAMSYTVSDSEMVDCVNRYVITNKSESISRELIITAIRGKYYKIPSFLAEVIADWYMA